MTTGCANLDTLTTQARHACDAQDFVTMSALCDKILQQDPCNQEALFLQARFGYWDPKLLTVNAQAAILSAQTLCEQIPEDQWFHTGTDIYMARKKQIAEQLEASLMMPSYSGAKQLHEVMITWLTFLNELPYLHVSLIESELMLCANLCTRSKMGFMPNDRLIYTAYTTLNNKESYGALFARILQPRLEQQRAYEKHLREQLQAHVAAANKILASSAASPSHPSQEDTQQTYDYYCALLENDLAKITGVTNKNLYQQQISVLTEQLENTKSYKLKQRHDITMRINALTKKINDIDEELAPMLNPLYQQLNLLQLKVAAPSSTEGSAT